MNRPLPPEHLLDSDPEAELFVPAPELWLWTHAQFLCEDGAFFNPDHLHLTDAEFGVLWAAGRAERHMNRIVATAELVNAKGSTWAKARERYQLRTWFGFLPTFLLTFDARWMAEEADEASYCAALDHELYHCGQKADAWGSPRFDPQGNPIFGLRGHDVEEFVGVTRRWGVGASAGRTAELVAAAGRAPLFSPAQIARGCGTCQS